MEFNVFDSIKIGLASPDQIRSWSHGIVEKPETINYRTQKPEKDGLFCERIFGPTKDWECHCGKYKKIRFKGKVCERCGVEVTRAKVRRERMGHIELAAPVSHIWYFKGTPSRIGQVLDISVKNLEEVLYFTKYIVVDPGLETGLVKNQMLNVSEYEDYCEKYEDGFYAAMGAEAIQELLLDYAPTSYDKYIEQNISLFAGVTGLSVEDIRAFLARRYYKVISVVTDNPTTFEAPVAILGMVIDRVTYREDYMRYNLLQKEYKTGNHIDVATGSDYIVSLFDEKIAEANVNGEYDEIADKAKWINSLEWVSRQLKDELKNLPSGQRRSKLLKRFEIIEAFRNSGNKPEWMVLDVVPVIPPDIRPMVMLDGGRYATSDLNDLYRRVINRNNRLKNMIEVQAPDIIVRNEKRMLQEAVDALIDNGRHGRPVTGPNNRALKSLSDMLKGKQGRFRQNLLGKRVDYSGRSVIVVGPELKMYQCGLPKEMALELFKPFVMKRLVDKDKVTNIKTARKMVERADNEVWDALENVIKDHPVLLNRAPTLHRLGIQAFEPILVEGRALKLHPLVCSAFNADFDGDQMAVHLPLSAEAQAEARFLMLAANNLLKPSDGRPVAIPTQDMVLGSYYLTLKKEGEIGEGKIFRDPNEALMAYQEGLVSLHAAIKVRMKKQVGDRVVYKLIDCTVGRLIFNENIPQDSLGIVDRSNSDKKFDLEVDYVVNKKELGKIIDKCIARYGTTTTSEILDKIKATGFKYSTKSAITVAAFDATIPAIKSEIIRDAESSVEKLNVQYRRGFMTDADRSKKFIDIWNNATNKVSKELMNNLKKNEPYNPIYMMADSGARGSEAQIRQLAGMRGLIANTAGTTIEMPIKANYREGLNILEYFISSRGARKGLADTALRTADSGYLTRRLVDVSQEVIIRETDCGTDEGIEVYEIKNGKEVIEPLKERLVGRFLLNDFRDEKTGEVISKNKLLTDADAQKIVDAGVKRIKIRSVLNCKAKYGVCAKCYGKNLANNELVTVGEAVGVIAAQSIGEPGTQLTMRTFHTGGVTAGDGDITQGLPRVEELFESRRPKGSVAIVAKFGGVVHISENEKKIKTITITDPATGESENYVIPFDYKICKGITEGCTVNKCDSLTTGPKYPPEILEILGPQAVQDYIITEVQKVYRLQGVDICDKHIEVIIRQMLRKVCVEDPGSSMLQTDAIMNKREIDEVNTELKQRLENGENDIMFVKYKPIIQGITKAASNSDSFLSAASFQETTRALTDAAIKGKTDHLVGLKENTIIGKLLPAGTGMPEYNDVQIIRNDNEHSMHI
ncbi:MAG: DNA-directed RNA polymerase subunit beta' [Oscillospiraceae bacterium]|nr:DNA-directed RNA polymerase subunit beta' [Oscillospiraceae bacterium]